MTKKNTYDQAELESLLDSLVDAEEIYDIGTQIRQNSASDVNYDQVLCCFQRAADKGHSGAQNDLGTMFREGFGCKSDISAAIQWYERAAEQGEPMAYYNLATIYLHGVDTSQNYRLAAKYMRQAADLDCVLACADLGTMYRFGDGVDQDFLIAAKWHFRAVQDGDVHAMGNLCDYYKELIDPALNGNIVAAQVLHFIYSNGYGDDTNPAIGWAWIRWAYDMCLANTEHELCDSPHGQLDYAFRKAETTLALGVRNEGDKYIVNLMQEYGTRLEPAWQPILMFGGELGFVRLIGKWWSNGWEFRRDTYDGSMELLEETEGCIFSDLSEVKSGWQQAAGLINEYPVHRLRPIYVHPEFGERAFNLMTEKATAGNGAIAAEELWREICFAETSFPAAL